MVHEHNKNGIASEMMICVTKTIHKVGSINLHSQRYYEIVTKDKLILYNTFLPIRLMQHLAASTKLYKKKKKTFLPNCKGGVVYYVSEKERCHIW